MTVYTKFKEYIWLVNTIHQAGKITFAEINERWLKTDMSGSKNRPLIHLRELKKAVISMVD